MEKLGYQTSHVDVIVVRIVSPSWQSKTIVVVDVVAFGVVCCFVLLHVVVVILFFSLALVAEVTRGIFPMTVAADFVRLIVFFLTAC